MKKYRSKKINFIIEKTVKTAEISFMDQIKLTEYVSVNERQITQIGKACRECPLYQLDDINEIYVIKYLNVIGQEYTISYNEYMSMINVSRVEGMEGFIVKILYGSKDNVKKEVVIKTYYTITSKKSKPKIFDIAISNNEFEYQNSFYKMRAVERAVNKYMKNRNYKVHINGMEVTNFFLNDEERSHKYCDCNIKANINEYGNYIVEYTEDVFELIEKKAA